MATRGSGEQDVCAVADHGEGREDRAQDQDLRRDRAAGGVHELGQEREEEDRDLRVEQLDEHAPEGEPRARRSRGFRLLLTAEQAARAEVDQSSSIGPSGARRDASEGRGHV
jgi:hypothetical protein